MATCMFVAPGCLWRKETPFVDHGHYYRTLATAIEYPDAHSEPVGALQGEVAPHTLRTLEQKEPWDLTLEEAIQIAVRNSQVIRDIGGAIVSAPAVSRTVLDPAVQESSPLSGVEAALSEFDAQVRTGLFYSLDERRYNNIFAASFGGQQRYVGNFVAEITKQAATGTRFALRNLTDYDWNDIPIPPNKFNHFYDTYVEAEFRHPLLRGGGLQFNRIAGPNAVPGVYNGVLIARINTDVALVDFEIAVQNLARDVEQAYWELYNAYRELDATRRNRDAALEAWGFVQTKIDLGATGYDKYAEALPREQYYAAEAAVQNSLSGSGPVLLGVYQVERRLRWLMGIPITDTRLIRPADAPPQVDIHFDWNDSLAQSFFRRPELRRQQWQIKRRELELVAAQNFRRVRLDIVGSYRFRGFGNDLFGDLNSDYNTPDGAAFPSMLNGDLQGYRYGFEMSTPIGMRLGHTAVRNAELILARERVIYREQERAVVRELADAFANLDRAFVVSRSNFNRVMAATDELAGRNFKVEKGAATYDVDYFDNLRRATIAEIAYHRAMTDYSLALLNIDFSRGMLLETRGVMLAEGPWSGAAHAAAAKEARRFGTYLLPHCYEEPCPVSDGPVGHTAVGPASAKGEPLGEAPAPAPREPLPEGEPAPE